jgi:hypothetical protein
MRPDQIVHPYYFGDDDLKKNCLWLRNLPPLLWFPPGSLWETACEKPEPHTIDRSGKRRYFTDSKTRRAHDRARTFQSIALAMADQWG